MGLYDHVVIEDGLAVEFPDLDDDPTRIDWQTKSLACPSMAVYKVTMDGRLFEEDAHYEEVPEDERPRYDEEIEGFAKDWERAFGSLSKVHEGWSDTNHHGIVEIHSTVNDEYVSFDLKFTDGELVEIARNE